MSAHLRTEADPIYRQHQYPPRIAEANGSGIDYERNNLLIDESKRRLNLQNGLAELCEIEKSLG